MLVAGPAIWRPLSLSQGRADIDVIARDVLGFRELGRLLKIEYGKVASLVDGAAGGGAAVGNLDPGILVWLHERWIGQRAGTFGGVLLVRRQRPPGGGHVGAG